MSTALRLEAEIEYQHLIDRGKWQGFEMADVCRASATVFGAYSFGYVPQPLHVEWNDDWDEHNRSSKWAPPEHGKTFHGVLVRFLWELGNNIHLQLMHASATAVVPTGTLRTAARHLYANARIHEVFPEMQIDRFGREQANNLALWLKRPGMHTDRDPSWVALGMGNQIHGRRVDGVCLDDILSFKNTRTPAGRAEVTGNVSNSIMGRVPAEGWIRFLGYPFFRDDCAHHIANLPNFHHKAYDIMQDIDGNPGPPGLWPDVSPDPQTGKLYGWPWQRVLDKEEETLELDWWRQWRCKTPSDEMSIYSVEMMTKALNLGAGIELGQPAPERIIPASGIDPATGEGSDKTAIITWRALGRRAHVRRDPQGAAPVPGARRVLLGGQRLCQEPRAHAESSGYDALVRVDRRGHPSVQGHRVHDDGGQQARPQDRRACDGARLQERAHRATLAGERQAVAGDT
jgi:hypothetical protein